MGPLGPLVWLFLMWRVGTCSHSQLVVSGWRLRRVGKKELGAEGVLRGARDLVGQLFGGSNG